MEEQTGIRGEVMHDLQHRRAFIPAQGIAEDCQSGAVGRQVAAGLGRCAIIHPVGNDPEINTAAALSVGAAGLIGAVDGIAFAVHRSGVAEGGHHRADRTHCRELCEEVKLFDPHPGGGQEPALIPVGDRNYLSVQYGKRCWGNQANVGINQVLGNMIGMVLRIRNPVLPQLRHGGKVVVQAGGRRQVTLIDQPKQVGAQLLLVGRQFDLHFLPLANLQINPFDTEPLGICQLFGSLLRENPLRVHRPQTHEQNYANANKADGKLPGKHHGRPPRRYISITG